MKTRKRGTKKNKKTRKKRGGYEQKDVERAKKLVLTRLKTIIEKHPQIKNKEKWREILKKVSVQKGGQPETSGDVTPATDEDDIMEPILGEDGDTFLTGTLTPPTPQWWPGQEPGDHDIPWGPEIVLPNNQETRGLIGELRHAWQTLDYERDIEYNPPPLSPDATYADIMDHIYGTFFVLIWRNLNEVLAERENVNYNDYVLEFLILFAILIIWSVFDNRFEDERGDTTVVRRMIRTGWMRWAPRVIRALLNFMRHPLETAERFRELVAALIANDVFLQGIDLMGGGRRKKKTRKYKGNKYPYKNITKKEAIADFIKLKSTTNPRSLTGLEIVNYGTEKLRVRTKYRGKSLIERWKDKKARKTLKKFANRLYKGSYTDSLFHAYRSAIALSWGTLSSMRTSAALQMYRKYNAKKVLDFTAGWGSRMTAALAADIDYIGIDSNKSLKKGYNKIIKATKKHTKSKVKLFFQPAETVDYSKLDYDFVFTSPPYEYLELYEHMKNYEGTKKIKQAHSATDKRRKNDGFYDTFLIPTIKEIYKHLPKGKWMCLNVPDLMYDKIKKKWKACNKKEDYMISKRVGSNMKSDDRRGQEFVYCWKK
tara:strand:+ start:5844 stop:7634 length:1791 start_codon:yes stop_codon:yes gene_type:complete